MPALFRSADARHDAVRAELVAPDHDADIGLIARRPHRWIAERIVAFETPLDFVPVRLIAGEAESELRLAGSLHLGNQFGQPAELSCAADNVHVGSPAPDELLILLSHTAQNAQDRVGVPALVETKSPECTVDLVFRVLTDATCVEQDD